MLHQTIKTEITAALRAKDAIRLDTLRGLNAMFQNQMIADKLSAEFLPDDKALALVKRAVKQRKDSIEQFEKGGRTDLADKERAELNILEAYLPQMMSRAEIRAIVAPKIAAAKSAGAFDAKSAGKFTGLIMKELAGKADGAEVKAVVDELSK
ncbi:MAG: GatB/YqeY domain-containing protein [Patescibacteria group bacterium]|nr:GatB/YqeY domain-containing protein [Patescibacteria group bacterium]MDE2172633.1 GatB/YqeY domain-containing protein [Patescibacteria group bacterium]